MGTFCFNEIAYWLTDAICKTMDDPNFKFADVTTIFMILNFI